MRWVGFATHKSAFDNTAFIRGHRVIVKCFGSSSQDHNAAQWASTASELDEEMSGTLLRILYIPSAQLLDANIVEAIRELSKLLNAHRFETVDAILSAVEPGKLSVEMMITLLRTTYLARTDLANWSTFLRQAADEIRRRGRDPGQVLRGLYAAQ